MADYPFAVGDAVEKVGGDYSYCGNVVAVFAKLSGAVRVVVEDARGLLFIFNPAQLRRLPPEVPGAIPAAEVVCPTEWRPRLMATVVLTFIDLEDGSVRVRMESSPPFNLRDDAEATQAQAMAAYVIEALSEKTKATLEKVE